MIDKIRTTTSFCLTKIQALCPSWLYNLLVFLFGKLQFVFQHIPLLNRLFKIKKNCSLVELKKEIAVIHPDLKFISNLLLEARMFVFAIKENELSDGSANVKAAKSMSHFTRTGVANAPVSEDIFLAMFASLCPEEGTQDSTDFEKDIIMKLCVKFTKMLLVAVNDFHKLHQSGTTIQDLNNKSQTNSQSCALFLIDALSLSGNNSTFNIRRSLSDMVKAI